MEFKEDGLDHIRIHVKGQTLLGRKLSDFYVRPFRTADNAEFKHLLGYSLYLRTGKKYSEFRHLPPMECLKQRLILGTKLSPRDNEFLKEYKEGILASLNSDPSLIEDLKASRLPLLVYNDLESPNDPESRSEISELYEEIRSEL